jgi:prevent-host-death family protein
MPPGFSPILVRIDICFGKYYHGHMSMVTKIEDTTIPAGKFKAQCLSLIDLVGRNHQAITITKRGKPVARLVPLEEEKPRKLFGFFAGHVVEEGDIVSPTGEAWDAERG